MNDIKVEIIRQDYDEDMLCESIDKIKLMNISGGKSHKCGDCNAVFKTNARLKEHIIIHTDNKPFACELCDKSYNSKSNLRKHIELHKNLEVICVQCPKVFCSKYQMRQHAKIHSKNGLLKCNFCTYETEQKTNLNIHVKRHINTFKLQCPYCDLTFSIKADRKKHIHTHLNVKMFKCMVCCKTFKQNTGLLNHKKIHEEANILCRFCDKSFVSMSNYKRHQITHSDEARFACHKCEKLFKRKADLKTHTNLSCINNLAVSINKFCQKVSMEKKNTRNQNKYLFFKTKNS